MTTDLPPQIGKVASRELALNGYTRYEELTVVTSKQLLAIHGVGPKAIRILEEELYARGLSFLAVDRAHKGDAEPRLTIDEIWPSCRQRCRVAALRTPPPPPPPPPSPPPSPPPLPRRRG